MARLTIGQKASRVLRFLIGVRNPHITARLSEFGFDQAALDEGWTLLRGVSGDRLAGVPLDNKVRAMIARIDAWENQWFPITAAVLRRHHPDVHDRVFHNLAQTDGPQVVLSVTAFLDRVDEVAAGPGGAAVLATLARHGLTADVMTEIRSVIAQVASLTAPASPIVDNAELAGREQAMWDYYLQWSAIARAVITDRRQLRTLGFLKARRGAPLDTGEAENPASGADGDDGDDALDDELDSSQPDDSEEAA